MKVIDIHTHGIGGYDTKKTTVENVLKIAEIHGSYGVTEIILAIYPSSINAMRENMETVKKAMEIQCSAVSNKHSRIIGVYLEGPFLNPAKCGALDGESFMAPSEYAVKELLEGFEDIVKIITIAPELDMAVNLIKKISDAGITVSMGHSDATYAEAEAGFHAGGRGITHIFNAMRGFHHREPGIGGFGLLNQDVYIEIIADPYHLHAKTLELIYRTKDPDKIIIVSDTIRETKATGKHMRGITNDSDRLAGGSMTVTESSERLIQIGYDERIIMNCVTTNPSRYLLRSA